jgi:hypothetical protein
LGFIQKNLRFYQPKVNRSKRGHFPFWPQSRTYEVLSIYNMKCHDIMFGICSVSNFAKGGFMACEVQADRPDVATRGLSPFRLMKLRMRLRKSACSETWVDDQIITITDLSPKGEEVQIVCFDSSVFPPGGRQLTRMRWCRRCGRYTPPACIHLIERRKVRFGPVTSATLQCDDCRIAVDDEIHRELYEAGLHLRPRGSQSFVLLRTLFSDRAHAH